MKKRILLLVSVLFYAGMLVLTLSARTLHEAGLPHVKVLEIGYKQFVKEDGNIQYACALPKEAYQEELYVISFARINDEIRTIARKVEQFEIGLENEDFYEVKNGLNSGNQVILGSLLGVKDGGEVYIEEEKSAKGGGKY